MSVQPGSYEHRFNGIARLVGKDSAERLRHAHVTVVGIGGVGSWAVEALARSGIGKITMIDWDDLCYTNVNRQIHALDGQIGRAKVDVMAERIRSIQPECEVNAIRDFFTADNRDELITNSGCHAVIDAIDKLTPKCWLIATCRRANIPIVCSGAAGGMIDPRRLKVDDLNRSYADPLLAQVRKKLKKDFGFSKKPGEKFKVECIFSDEPKVFPREDGSVCAGKIESNGTVNIGCDFGYGSASFVTGTVAFLAVGRVIQHLLKT
jgi:tRNA threonylcarbamoyladenosine dehydratase